MSNQMNTMDIKEILQYLPHRYPFLLIDRVLDYTPGVSLQAIKNVSINEPFFQGHFPVQPVMPGVLILEAMAQATGLLAFKTMSDDVPPPGVLYYFAGIDNARFRRVVEPGDQIHFEVKMIKERRGIGVFYGEAKVDGELVCSAEIMCARREISQ
ncbi:3-hydroxyacyl-ACP dehydratase FabZ [Shewanella glacialipiscicola]|uniref:3-hydroxyacyl-[acyl-carrier-protein] dehydratase FabZ n=1 Tax=Shewanella glacialipiscicola TaxID=614069 RepID=A0ABQ6J3M7_9GAMM|nr:3-hydroxyacyl-ACP dehydratase FabZ [Shewanella glacialipiscicola]MCL1084876.1 3-hydroxyacyl-ACP dehydratase FabZ [Shewanella glacialipiscicola]MCU7995052.1 3-hydroxyacyl-ACP dehydratase FabZ [Shewanella glacialipiscicola]MCU8026460.1 3-hydroxyacyl-ACP dehydratase FabZ [Shewanella glacialipiscicola]GIU09452.1 3-hydroxyacyl-[acyl-carrier-protein] dehydratase FabZ [Shewanella glacialipiscicola]GMA82736.1 3-hydroxyacyl-[acyl-carrier-protein] dehydratase FabZ [Shewanella glacialipiscicola]